MPSLTVIREKMIEAFEEDRCAEPMKRPSKVWKNLWFFRREVIIFGRGVFGPGKVLGFAKWPSKEIAEMKADEEMQKFEVENFDDIEWIKSVEVNDQGNYAED